jgi:hypothetical protein
MRVPGPSDAACGPMDAMLKKARAEFAHPIEHKECAVKGKTLLSSVGGHH